MRIKLAILENDRSYLDRIIAFFNNRYADKVEVYSFSDQSVAMSTLETSKIDVFLAGESYDIVISDIPKRCGFAYFVDSQGIETIKDQPVICKYQSIDLIYKQILAIYSDISSHMTGVKLGDDNCKLVVFSSPAGGVGTSSLAASCSIYHTVKGHRTLYLNLEKFGSSDVFFSAEGSFDMTDLIFALKSRKSNFILKLESCVKKDIHGVSFFSHAKTALDMLELNAEETLQLINEIKMSGFFDYIIADMDFDISKEAMKVLKMADFIVWVSDGSDASNTKVFRAYKALEILSQSQDFSIAKRIKILYNKFSSQTSNKIEGIELDSIGGAPRYDRASTQQVLDQLSGMRFFDTLM
ncbi:MAG: chromosome partitioning protein ParA [Clostridiales bacterium]|nr:chromosome partitioning protein ParA [Clostridiales bacterium]